jgi:hypothetical protein
MRNGDMVGLLNAVEHLRRQMKEPVKFHMLPGTISDSDYCIKFFEFLKTQTDYFSEVPGNQILSWSSVNLWDLRDICGDIAEIKNDRPMKNKIVIFPLLDAPYNGYRNWTPELLQNIINLYNDVPFQEKIICCKTPLGGIDTKGFEISTDFMTNIDHIMDCHTFVGGETGTSIFASALNRGPKELVYYYSSRALLHTTPFNALNGKGKIVTYWLNFDGTSWT